MHLETKTGEKKERYMVVTKVASDEELKKKEKDKQNLEIVSTHQQPQRGDNLKQGLSFETDNVSFCVSCGVVTVQPRFNFSDEVIK